MAETPPPHPTPLPPPCPECLCDWPLHAASCSSAPAPRRREVEWPVVLLIAIVLFTVAGLVLNLAGLFR